MKELDFVAMGQAGSEKVATALEISGAERSTHKHGDVTVVAYMHHDDTVTALQAEVDRLREAARAVVAAADKWNAERSREAFEAMSRSIDATRAALNGDDA